MKPNQGKIKLTESEQLLLCFAYNSIYSDYMKAVRSRTDGPYFSPKEYRVESYEEKLKALEKLMIKLGVVGTFPKLQSEKKS
jgi:hypothetical protein